MALMHLNFFLKKIFVNVFSIKGDFLTDLLIKIQILGIVVHIWSYLDGNEFKSSNFKKLWKFRSFYVFLAIFKMSKIIFRNF